MALQPTLVEAGLMQRRPGFACRLSRASPLSQREQASARGRCSSTRGRTAEKGGCCWRREEEAGEATWGRRRTPPPPAGRGAAARTPDTGGRLARSLTRREDWPRDAVGVRRSGGNSLPHCWSCRVPSPGTAPSNCQAMAPGSPSPGAMRRKPKAGGRGPPAPGAQSTRTSAWGPSTRC